MALHRVCRDTVAGAPSSLPGDYPADARSVTIFTRKGDRYPQRNRPAFEKIHGGARTRDEDRGDEGALLVGIASACVEQLVGICWWVS